MNKGVGGNQKVISNCLKRKSGVNAAGHVLDYGEVNIGGKSYLLPVRSIAYVRVGRFESREEIEYSHHRKFTTEATVNFIEDPADQETTPGKQQTPPR